MCGLEITLVEMALISILYNYQYLYVARVQVNVIVLFFFFREHFCRIQIR